jgi:glycosyltransferase involved in cell wall biosynthesis
MLRSNLKDDVLVKNNISELVNELTDKKKFLKVAILISAFSKFEGASRVAEHQALELSENSASVTIFTFNADLDSRSFRVNLINPLVPFRNPFLKKVYRASFPVNLIKVSSLLNKLNDFDVIILHHPTLANLAFFCKKIYGTKVVVYNHHADGDSPVYSFTPQGISEKIYNQLVWSLYWKTIKRFDTVISVSKYSRKRLKEKKGIDSIVIYNKIDHSRFKKGLDENRIRSRYNINNDPLILFIGRIIPSKGIHLLIDAFKKIKLKIPHVKLLIVGKHYDREYSEKLMRLSDESIFFAEQISDGDLPFYYAACDVYATCSLQEGFNLTIVEAQACGKPVVAFDIGPHEEVLDNGYLVSEYDLKDFSERLVELLLKRSRNVQKNG